MITKGGIGLQHWFKNYYAVHIHLYGNLSKPIHSNFNEYNINIFLYTSFKYFDKIMKVPQYFEIMTNNLMAFVILTIFFVTVLVELSKSIC